MADIRCPMCGKTNAAEAEVCAYCQARLVPLNGPAQGQEGGEATPGETIPDWLTRLRAQGSSVNPPGTRELSGEPEAPAGEEQAADWLARIKARAEEEDALAAPQAPVPEGTPADLHKGGQVPGESSFAAAPQADQTAPEEEEPEWLKRLRARQAVEQPPPAPVSPSIPSAVPSFPGEQLPPDWLHMPREEAPPATGTPPQPRPPAGPEVPGGPTPAGGPKAGALPDWLQDIESQRPRGAAGEAPPSAQPAQAAPPPSPQAPGQARAASPFSGGAEELAPATGEEQIPDWLASVRSATEAPVSIQAGPAEPARPGEAPRPPSETPALEELLAPGVLPDWLVPSQPGTSAPTTEPPPEPAEALEKGVLPPWLQAMRPVQGPAVVGEAEEEPVESAGPLAGLKGVLPPELELEVGRRPAILPAQLEISPAHAAHAELLQRIVASPEQRVVLRAARRPQSRPWAGLAISLVLIAAVLLPWLTQTAVFARPSVVGAETLQTAARIDALPTDRPVLLVVDYDPANTAELEPGALALIDHLMSRGIPLASLSTRPAGPALAERLVALERQAHPDYAPGQKYLPLGYLPGGTVGIRAFAADPRQAPGSLVDSLMWQAAPLAKVNSAGDFSALVVVASEPTILQAWIEQVHTAFPALPMLAVISAAAEPVARPYYESESPALRGMVVGLAGAEAYECLRAPSGPASGRCGNAGLADASWDAFGMAMLAAAMILTLGGFASITARAVRTLRSRSHG